MQAGLDVGDSDQARSCAQIVCGTQYTKLTHVSVQKPTHFTNLYPEQGCSLAVLQSSQQGPALAPSPSAAVIPNLNASCPVPAGHIPPP